MKITKARLLEIINEEVADYAKRLQQEESDTLEVSEESLQEMIGVDLEERATENDLDAAIRDDKKVHGLAEKEKLVSKTTDAPVAGKSAAKPPAKPAAKPAAKPK